MKASRALEVGFWGHLQSKGFRAKSIEHSKIQIGAQVSGHMPDLRGLDLPKAIQLQSIGHCIGVPRPLAGTNLLGLQVRSLYTTFDSAQGKDPVQMSIGGMIRVRVSEDLQLALPSGGPAVDPSLQQEGEGLDHTASAVSRQGSEHRFLFASASEELMKLPYPNTEHTTARR